MISRITITGTESTGKSTLAEKLAGHYKTVFVPDYSRHYISLLERRYNHTDVLHIAKGIIEEENKMAHYAHHIFFSDNDLINIKIWLRHYKWAVPGWLEDQILKRKSDLYLLCDVDLPWIADEQRQNPNDRNELFNQFKNELVGMHANFEIVSGTDPKPRLNGAVGFVDHLLSSKLQ